MPHQALTVPCFVAKPAGFNTRKLASRFFLPFLLILLASFFAYRFLITPESLLLNRLFSPPSHSVNSPPVVAIVIVSDPAFAVKYKSQARSVQCYAETHKYEFYALNPADVAPVCAEHHQDFFFRKHCTVAQWMRTRPPGSVVVVLDGDVVAGTSNLSLNTWLQYDFDFASYERSWNFEVMSGNYIVRNTKFARMFLHHWASYEYIKPRGFSSSDNGAIHLALLEALAIRGRQRCRDLYRNLEASVTDLEPYFEFVACTKMLLGPPRTYVARYAPYLDLMDMENAAGTNSTIDEELVAGKIVIFPRFFGFVVDSRVHGYTGFRNLHPFHHGLKEEEWKDEYLDSEVRGTKGECQAFSVNGTISRKEMGNRLKSSDNYMMAGTDGDPTQVPRWGHVDESCYQRLWCGPLKEVPDQWPEGMVARNGTIVKFDYEEPGADWLNGFAATMHVVRKGTIVGRGKEM